MSSIYDLRMEDITGEQVDFDRFRGQVLLIVNVASA
jgi:glutathione peroxidase-family protein